MPDDLSRSLHRRSMLRLLGTATATVVTLPLLEACSPNESAGYPPDPAGTEGSSPGGTSMADFAGYGPLVGPDANGLMLPEGFTSRIVAVTGEEVAETGFEWPVAPDGGAVFETDDRGWIYVSNSEAIPGGASMLRFDESGAIIEARSILEDTAVNCAGGATPWGTWLSCEEHPTGRVWECDPTGLEVAAARPAMGVCKHEAAAADPEAEVFYLTEDEPDGALYRFRPTTWGDLAEGELEVLVRDGKDALNWQPLPDPSAEQTALRKQLPNTEIFKGGEGAAVSNGALYFTTKFDNRIWRLEPVGDDGAEVTVVWDGEAQHEGATVVNDVDNVTIGPQDLPFVAEDGEGLQLVVVGADGTMFPFAQVTDAPGSEITGPAFTQDGGRVYFSSQRSPGKTYEVSGPFNP